ncbi:MAG: hypothetical protein L6W00_16050 [Lentisphaeria bacterium]|nr:MAG: hypothetical protein L6W00_16050 [Lentisphaeria bacterium]
MNIAQRVACVLPSPPRMIYDRAAHYSNVIDLTLGDPDLPPPLNVREAACRAIMAGKNPLLRQCRTAGTALCHRRRYSEKYRSRSRS